MRAATSSRSMSVALTFSGIASARLPFNTGSGFSTVDGVGTALSSTASNCRSRARSRLSSSRCAASPRSRAASNRTASRSPAAARRARSAFIRVMDAA
ncbi:hypothetical protein LMTR3_14190 [Bradyrhizobium sp. LMTR 3]|nr:hypothetical protein LMTR3_14190 [Bradyrhizobium sp. LMTR 3]